jgi:DnaJ-class molecular chaperone
MKTVLEWFRELQGWRRESCSKCGGHGLVSSYSWNDSHDFLGADECVSCGGTGTQWRTPKGRYVLYPGGPFC